MQKGLLLTFLLLILSACGRSASSVVYEDEFVPVRSTQSVEEIKNPATVSVAVLSNRIPKLAGAGLFEGCTSFLIENNTMVTNAHCVPGKAAGDSCAEINFKFFKAGAFNEEEVVCEKILFVSVPKTFVFTEDRTEIVKDYAYLKIKKASSRPPLKISYEGVDDLEPVSVISVNFAANKLVQNSCYVKYGTNIYPSIKQKVGPVFQMNDCAVVKGNSGSPVINSKGVVVGIVSDEVWAEKSPRTTLPLKRAGLATNFSCATPPHSNQAINASPVCQVLSGAERKKIKSAETLFNTRKAFDEVERQQLELVQKNSQNVVWGYAPQRGSTAYYFNAYPICVDTEAAPKKVIQRLTSFQVRPYTDVEHVSVIDTQRLEEDVEFNITVSENGKYKVIARSSAGVKEHVLPGCNKLNLFQGCLLTPEKCPLTSKARLID